MRVTAWIIFSIILEERRFHKLSHTSANNITRKHSSPFVLSIL